MKIRAGVLLTLGLVAAAVVGCRPKPAAVAAAAPTATASQDQGVNAPDFPATLQWLNTDRPLSMRDLRGKVVLLDFWTYCCINCMHIIPDLKKLEAKYPNELQVIGVHTAKFLNEKDAGNIREAILRYDIEHPVINDRDQVVWNSYGVNSWPTLALIAPDGKLVGGVSGEGNFEVLDRAIQRLITDYSSRGLLDRKPLKFVLEKENRPKSVLSYPGKITADPAGGRLFITDSNHNRVIVTSLSGAIQTVIGKGTIGLKDGDFATAEFFRPQGLSFDAAHNALYVADTENHAVRKIDLAAGKVTTLAGNGKQASWPPSGGTGRAASLSSPWDVLVHGDRLFIAMAGTHQLWSLDLDTLKTRPYAGNARENIVDAPLLQASLAQPSGLASDGQELYFADSEVSAVRQCGLNGGAVKTLIGEGLFEFGDKDGAYPAARLQHPIGVAYSDGYVYVADTYNHKIKRVNPRTRTLETFIGTGARGMADGPATQAQLNEPNGLVWVGKKLYIADTNNSVIRVYDAATKTVSTLRFTGQEKLEQRAAGPSTPSTVINLPAQEIAVAARSLDLVIQLPKGTKFNAAAPFRAVANSTDPNAITAGPLNLAAPAARIAIPLAPKAGSAVLQVDLTINYCATGNEGLCYFKDVRLRIPLKVTPTGNTTPTATYAM